MNFSKRLQYRTIRTIDLEKLVKKIYVSKELDAYIKFEYNSNSISESYENYKENALLKACENHIKNAFVLANIEKSRCLFCDHNHMAFNTGLVDCQTRKPLLALFVTNNGKYEFSKWSVECNYGSNVKLENPFLISKAFWDPFKSEKCDCSPSGHFLIDHLDRLPKNVKKEDLLNAFGLSWNRAKENCDTVLPIIYQGEIQYAVPIYFNDMDDCKLIAVCKLVKKTAETSRFEAVTKLTKEMIRSDMLLRIFEEEKWLNPMSDNVCHAKNIICLDVRKPRSAKYDVMKNILRVVSFPAAIPFVASAVLYFLKGKRK